MGLLVFLGCLMCSVLLVWAALQQPCLSRTLSVPPPRNPHQWTHSVIFGPWPGVQLARSTYRVTSFLDFGPFIKGFQTVDEYLDSLWADVLDPCHFQCLFVPISHIDMDPALDDSHVGRFLDSCMCVQHPYACWAGMRFGQFQWGIHCIKKIFHSIYKRFLTAVGHVDCHLSWVQTNVARSRRSIAYGMYG